MEKAKKIITNEKIQLILLILVAIISILLAVKVFNNPVTYKHTISSLDSKRDVVLKLTAGSTAVSAAITVLPGDVATPIAEKLADLSTYFIIILCAISLEKYLLTIIGVAAFGLFIPVSCAVFIFYLLLKSETLRRFGIKLLIFAIATFAVIPTSVGISTMIEKTYELNYSETADQANEVGNNPLTATDKAKDILNNFVESIAVMIVTTCLIPILVIMFFIWLIKGLFEININVPSPSKIKNKVRSSAKRLTNK